MSDILLLSTLTLFWVLLVSRKSYGRGDDFYGISDLDYIWSDEWEEITVEVKV